MPLDITDEEAVWQALTATVTVLDDRKDKAQVRQVTVRKEPRADSEGIGMVTMVSQGVHVLERGEEWSLIECFSSSFVKSDILNWNAPVRGYVRTELLRNVVPNQEMGMVVDKLTQRLYIFREGKLFTTLLVSTGEANAKQPYNETRSGEFLFVSRVGSFMSDNLNCRMAIRFNADDLIHEVPRIEKNDWIDYSTTEPKLGTRASHGCIRVQRKKNPLGGLAGAADPCPGGRYGLLAASDEEYLLPLLSPVLPAGNEPPEGDYLRGGLRGGLKAEALPRVRGTRKKGRPGDDQPEIRSGR